MTTKLCNKHKMMFVLVHYLATLFLTIVSYCYFYEVAYGESAQIITVGFGLILLPGLVYDYFAHEHIVACRKTYEGSRLFNKVVIMAFASAIVVLVSITIISVLTSNIEAFVYIQFPALIWIIFVLIADFTSFIVLEVFLPSDLPT